MNPLRAACPLAAFVLATAFAAALPGQERQNRAFVRNLDNPTGIAIHPQTGDLFIAEVRGIVRVQRTDDGRERGFQVRGFPTDEYGKGPIYDIGPLGVAFLGGNHLVVGDGSRPDTDEVILIYEFGDDLPERPMRADDAVHTLGPLDYSEEVKAEGNFYGVVVTEDAIFATANGDDTKGWIVKVPLQDGRPGELQRAIATKEALFVDAPVAITTNSEGQLVVGQMGEINLPGDSLLAFFDPDSGELIDYFETGLNDITGLAYSPVSGKLYATDFSWLDTSQGGLFELTLDDAGVETRKVRELDKPTAIAFDADGHAYVTVLGTAEEGSDRKPGQVIRIPRRMLEQ